MMTFRDKNAADYLMKTRMIYSIRNRFHKVGEQKIFPAGYPIQDGNVEEVAVCTIDNMIKFYKESSFDSWLKWKEVAEDLHHVKRIEAGGFSIYKVSLVSDSA